MNAIKVTAVLLVLASTSLAWLVPERADDEHKAVERACLDYVDGIYEVKPELIERSVHEDLRKIGFGRWGDQKEYRVFPMTYEQLYGLAGKWNADGTKANADSPREVVILDVLDQTASAKLTAEWGIDYFHLAKYEGKWKIINVLWQSHPPVEGARDE